MVTCDYVTVLPHMVPAAPPRVPLVVLEALADLRDAVEALQADRQQLPPPTGSAQVTVEDCTMRMGSVASLFPC